MKNLLQYLEKNKKEAVKLLQDLISFPSVNHPPDGDEKECQQYVAKRMQRMGLQMDIFTPDEVKGIKKHPAYLSGRNYKNRPNVVGMYKGKGGGRSLVLVAHSDVMPPGDIKSWRYNPWSGKVVNGSVYGRGSIDDKGGIAMEIMALQSILALGYQLKGDVILASVVDEEYGGANGTLACLLRGYKADAGIYVDCKMEIGVANLGGGRLNIEVTSNNSGDITEAKDIAMKTYDVLRKLNLSRMKEFKKHPLYKVSCQKPIIPVEILIGDSETSDKNKTEITCYYYVLPGETNEKVLKGIKGVVIKKVGNLARKLTFSTSGRLMEPSAIAKKSPIVGILADAFKTVTGKKSSLSGGPMSDLFMLNLYGKIPSVSFGPGRGLVEKGGPHQFDENLSIENNLLPATKILALSILEWCGYAVTGS